MNDGDDIFGDTPIPEDKFANLHKGDRHNFEDSCFHIYEVAGDYTTIHIRKKYATAKLMAFMERNFGVVYIGPMIDWTDGSHLTFRKR